MVANKHIRPAPRPCLILSVVLRIKPKSGCVSSGPTSSQDKPPKVSLRSWAKSAQDALKSRLLSTALSTLLA